MDFLKKLSTNQKILIGVGVLAVVLIVAVMLYRRMAKKKDVVAKPIASGDLGGMMEAPMQAPQQRSRQQAPQQQGGNSERVLVMFYAPWCGHCKRLEPIWEEFTQNFDGYNGVRILKINGDENQQYMQLHNLRGFPSVKFCPRGIDNPEGIMFEGDRSLNSLAAFLQQNA